jgi:D-aminopeptidase
VVGDLPPGPQNAVTDVVGVRVGHATLITGAGVLRPGSGPVRTGVTVIRPHAGSLFREKVRAAVHAINGFGKACGFEQIRELGTLEAPIALTNTLNVGLVADAHVRHALPVEEVSALLRGRLPSPPLTAEPSGESDRSQTGRSIHADL